MSIMCAAFAYLSEYAPLEALERFSVALKRYASARGKTQLYHETITHAYFFLIRERMARYGSKDWEEFSRKKPRSPALKNCVLTGTTEKARCNLTLPGPYFCFPITAVNSRQTMPTLLCYPACAKSEPRGPDL